MVEGAPDSDPCGVAGRHRTAITSSPLVQGFFANIPTLPQILGVKRRIIFRDQAKSAQPSPPRRALRIRTWGPRNWFSRRQFTRPPNIMARLAMFEHFATVLRPSHGIDDHCVRCVLGPYFLMNVRARSFSQTAPFRHISPSPTISVPLFVMVIVKRWEKLGSSRHHVS